MITRRISVPFNISLTPIKLMPTLNFEVIPGCPHCATPNLARLDICAVCGASVPESYRGTADVHLMAPWYARLLLWIGNFFREAGSRC